MATPTPPPTTGPSIGTSRLLGTNGLQQAVDSLTRQINKLASGLGRVGGNTSGSNTGGYSGFGSQWNTTSNRPAYSANGGGGRFTVGSMRGGNANGGGGNFGNLVGMSRMSATVGAGAGIASALTSYANSNMASNFQLDYFGTQSSVAGGGGRAGNNLARALAVNNNYVGLNATDVTKAGYINQYTFGNAQFNGQANPAFTSGMRQANAFAYASPTLGAYGGALAAQQTYSARAAYVAPALGLASPYLTGGVKNSMSNIAQSIYSRTFGNQKLTTRQFDAAIQQGGSLDVNLQYFGQAMGWNDSTIQEYRNILQGQVAAQNKGMSESKYYKLLGQASGGNRSAINQLAKTTNMGTSMFENQRNLNATRLTRQNDILDTLAPAFDAATQAVNKFSQALTEFMKATNLDKAVGWGAGTLSPFSNALGGLSGGLGAGLGIFGAARLMSGGGGFLGGLGGMFGGGAAGAGAGGLINATRGAGGAYNITSLGGGGMSNAAIAARLTGVLGLVLGGGYGLSKIAKTDAAGNPTKGQSFTDWLKGTFSWTGIKNTFNVKENTRNIWEPIAGLFGYDKPASDGRAGGANDAKGGGGGSKGAASSVTNGSGATGAQVIKYAEQQLGDPYVWGGTGPNGWDCSGLMQWAFGKAGVKLPRVAKDQQRVGKAVATDKVQPGDLLFQGNPAHHVVMAIGGGKIIEAPRTGLNVRIRSFTAGEFTNARRILGSVGNMSDISTKESADATLNDQQSTVGGNIGGGYGGTSELAAIMGALGGGTGGGVQSLNSQTTSSSNTADSSSSTVKGSNPPGNPKGNIALGKKLAASKGWTGNQWKALYNLWQRESGWNEKADNPNSDAYGIPQSLPGSKMASAGSDWKTNPETQIKWGLSYIKERYGTPAKAWSFWNSKNPHWYDKGAWEIGQDVTARVHKGEMIIPAQQAETIRQTLLNNTFNPNLQKATGSGSATAGISFGDININLPSTYTGTAQEARDLGKTIVTTMEEQLRLKNLQIGQ